MEAEARRIGVIGDGRPPSARAISYGSATPHAIELDAISMAEWLDARIPGVLREPIGAYLDASMADWYGLEMDQLSACTWMDYFVIPAPGADERWHVRGGNDQVPNLLADRLPQGTLHLDAPLEGIRVRSDEAYELRFGGAASPVPADVVILALPFTTLRRVDLTEAGFGVRRRAAIDELGMGTDVKLLLQYDRRPREFHVNGRPWSGGMEHTDPNFQTSESSAGQPGLSASSRCTRADARAGAGRPTSSTRRRPTPSRPSTWGWSTGSSRGRHPPPTARRGWICGPVTRGPTARTRRSCRGSSRGSGATPAEWRAAFTSPGSTRRPIAGRT